MDIAIVHHQFNLKGGMETYLLNLITGFNHQADKVTVFVYKKNKIKNAPVCRVKRKNIMWLPRPLRKYWFGAQVCKRKEMRNYNITISLMRSFYQDMVICGGTHLGFLTYTGKKASLLDKWEIACERKSYLTSTFIVAHSKLLREELIQLYGVPIDKILMCYPPVDTHKFNQNLRPFRQDLRKKFNIHQDKKVILFPSTGHKRKGFFILLAALQKLPATEYELVVAGNPPAKTAAPNIKYVGFVEDMAALYSACDMTVLPSYYEPFGLVVIESLECGTPVIVSPFVGAKDLITQNEGVILESLSPQALERAITYVANHIYTIRPNFAKRMNLTIEAHVAALKAINSP